MSLLLLWPLLHPASLPRQAISMLLAAPAPPAAPVLPVQRAASVAAHPVTPVNPFAAPVRIPTHIADAKDVPQAVAENLSNPLAQQGAGLPSGLADSIGTAATPQVHVARPPKLAISSGVMAGNKLSGAAPQYPAIAHVAGVQGTVVLGATISRSGTIENLHVISGPPMLILRCNAGGAYLAVSALPAQWRAGRGRDNGVRQLSSRFVNYLLARANARADSSSLVTDSFDTDSE